MLTSRYIHVTVHHYIACVTNHDTAHIRPKYHFIILFIYRWNTKEFVLYLRTGSTFTDTKYNFFRLIIRIWDSFDISIHEILRDHNYRYSKNHLCIWLQNFKKNYVIHFGFELNNQFYYNLWPRIISHFQYIIINNYTSICYFVKKYTNKLLPILYVIGCLRNTAASRCDAITDFLKRK